MMMSEEWVKGKLVFPKDIKAVEVRAELRQVRTMADGTVNVILNLPEDCIPQVKVMLDWLGLELRVVMVEE